MIQWTGAPTVHDATNATPSLEGVMTWVTTEIYVEDFEDGEPDYLDFTAGIIDGDPGWAATPGHEDLHGDIKPRRARCDMICKSGHSARWTSGFK